MEPWYRAAELALVPPFRLWFNWRLEGLERVPAEGPAIIAGNHLSYLDPFAHGVFVVKAGRRPRFLAKQELFDAPFVGTVLRGAHQISVQRGSGRPIADRRRGSRGRAGRGGRDLPGGDDHHDERGLLAGSWQDRRRPAVDRHGDPDPPGRHLGGSVRLAQIGAPEPGVRTADLGGRGRAVRPNRTARGRARRPRAPRIHGRPDG